jgi:hypothetical protein
MIKEALEYLIGLKRPEVVNVDGRIYATTPLTPVKLPEPAALTVHTLTAVRDYVLSHMDGRVVCHSQGSAMLHVESHERVSVIGVLDEPFLQRKRYMEAALVMEPFPYGRFLDPETFIIALQTRFIEDENRNRILKLTGNVTDSLVQTLEDDGITQGVTTRAGATLKGNAEVPNPIELRPYRTFLEVDQPKSLFVLRAKKGMDGGGLPTFALFEADGGAWKNEAIKNIAAWLNGAMPDAVILA